MDTRKVNITEIGTKAQSKAELYRLLTVEGGMYLPPQDQTNIEFISDIAFSVKKVSNHLIMIYQVCFVGSILR